MYLWFQPLLDITVQADQIVANMGGQDVPTGEVRKRYLRI